MPSMSFVSFTSKQTPAAVEPTPDHVESLSTTRSVPPVTAAEDSDKSAPVTTPSDDTSEPQSLSQVFYPSLAALKDQRAYEHERQRSKKAADLAKAKARKGQWSLLTYDSKKAFTLLRSSSTRTPEKSRRLSSEEVTTVDALSIGATGNHTGPTHVSLGGVGGDVAVQGNDKSEVKLADLISSGSVRKPRARKVKDSDYEVVPHVRSVIVLDDITTRDVTFDEPWEHIDHSDSDDSSSDTGVLKKNVKKTYASILSVNGNDNPSSK